MAESDADIACEPPICGCACEFPVPSPAVFCASLSGFSLLAARTVSVPLPLWPVVAVLTAVCAFVRRAATSAAVGPAIVALAFDCPADAAFALPGVPACRALMVFGCAAISALDGACGFVASAPVSAVSSAPEPSALQNSSQLDRKLSAPEADDPVEAPVLAANKFPLFPLPEAATAVPAPPCAPLAAERLPAPTSAPTSMLAATATRWDCAEAVPKGDGGG